MRASQRHLGREEGYMGQSELATRKILLKNYDKHIKKLQEAAKNYNWKKLLLSIHARWPYVSFEVLAEEGLDPESASDFEKAAKQHRLLQHARLPNHSLVTGRTGLLHSCTLLQHCRGKKSYLTKIASCFKALGGLFSGGGWGARGGRAGSGERAGCFPNHAIRLVSPEWLCFVIRSLTVIAVVLLAGGAIDASSGKTLLLAPDISPRKRRKTNRNYKQTRKNKETLKKTKKKKQEQPRKKWFNSVYLIISISAACMIFVQACCALTGLHVERHGTVRTTLANTQGKCVLCWRRV